MKNTVLSSAILATLFSVAGNAATVYQDDTTSLKIGGRAEARANISDNNKSDENSAFKDKSRARVNLKGKTEIMDGLGAFGTYELEIADGKDNSVNTRYLFAGLDTQAGAFSYGQQDSAQVILTDFTDILATFGGDAADLVDGNKDKRENNFVYSYDFNALTLTANYIASNEKDNDTYGISGMYSLPMGLDLGAGYVSGKDSNEDVDQYNIVVRYTINDIYFAGLYAGGSEGNTDLSGYELAAAYKLNKLTLQGVYNFQKEDPKAEEKTDTVDNFAIEAIYKFNGNFRTYAGYKFEQLDNKDDQIQIGARYDF